MEISDSKIDVFYKDAGKSVKAARIKAGVSQTTLAGQIGFNRSSIANLEAGRQRITLHVFCLIAEALNVKPAALLPDTHLLEEVDSTTIENLSAHLAGTSETTQDFVRETVARMTAKSPRVGD